MDDFNHTVRDRSYYQDIASAAWEAFRDCDWVSDNNMEWVIEKAIVDDTADVFVEDTALLGSAQTPRTSGSDQTTGSSRSNTRKSLPVGLIPCLATPKRTCGPSSMRTSRTLSSTHGHHQSFTRELPPCGESSAWCQMNPLRRAKKARAGVIMSAHRADFN